MSEIEYDKQEVQNHILMLIGADDVPVQGKTLFVYQIFLIFKEVSPEVYPPFFPYQLGPYSNAVSHECNWLISNKFVTAAKKGRGWTFELTDKGKSFIATLSMNTTPSGLIKRSQISRIKKCTHDIGLKKTTKFLKKKYPEYFINARI